MKPHPGIRKTIKWGGLALTVVLVVVWIGSGWWMVSVFVKPPQVHSIRAALTLNEGCVGVGPWWSGDWRAHVEARPFALRWVFDLAGRDSIGAWRGQRVIPLWFVAATVAVPTAVAWRRDAVARRRTRLNLCPSCNYDRTGLAHKAKCPECGALPPPASTAPSAELRGPPR